MAAAAQPPPQPQALLQPTDAGEWGHTSIVALWVPVLIASHVFACFWLWRAWRVHSPPRRPQQQRASSGGGSPTSALHAKWAAVAVATKAAAAPWARNKAGNKTADGAAAAADVAAIELDAVAATGGGCANGGRDNDGGNDVAGRGSSDDQEEALQALGAVAADGGDADAAAALAALRARPLSPLSEPATLEWRGVGCSYGSAHGAKVVLADVWGVAPSGEMQALLGPSGAGKSTLMDILAMRKSLGTLTGELLVNGERATRAFVRSTAYVPQEDNFVCTMTTEEILTFYANIILPQSWPSERRRTRVAEVLAEVGLTHARGTIAGGALPGGLLLRGLSGGERKRLSVAAGILAAPTFLFLDEPTSGLDSFAALTVMGYLKRLAREHSRVVIASIHQPRAAIWAMFDAVTLLASGRLMYHGPRDEMTAWFAGLGYRYDADAHGVPSDWALDLVATGFPKPARYYGSTIATNEQLLSAAAAFKRQYTADMALARAEAGSSGGGGASGSSGDLESGSASGDVGSGGGAAGDDPSMGGRCAAPIAAAARAAARRCAAAVERGGAPLSSAGAPPPAAAAAAATYPTGPVWQFRTLLGRELLAITRNPFDVAARVLTFAWVGVFMGVLNFGVASDAAAVTPRLALLHIVLCFYLLMPYISMGLYTADKRFVVADASSKLYRPLAYYLAKIVAIAPFHVAAACTYSFIIYGMAGLRPGAGHILKNALINTQIHLAASQVLHAAAVVAPNQDVAFMISILWTAVQMLLSGFFFDFSRVWVRWVTYLRYLSTVYYGFHAVAANEFGGVLLPCAAGGPPSGDAMGAWVGQSLPNTSNEQRKQLGALFARYAQQGACVFDPAPTLEHFDIARPFWANAGILFGYIAALHVLTYLAMIFTARRERR